VIAYWCAVFLAGVLVGIVLGGAYALREARREYEDRLRLARRYR
jgi:N-acetylmuramic acid 6-phosphate (MurNAc-6-P) etherase